MLDARLKYLFAASDDTIAQTDIVMLLTPRIIRTHEYTARDLSPIYVGTNQNFGLTGPPPLIAAPPVEPDARAGARRRAAGASRAAAGAAGSDGATGGTPGPGDDAGAADAACTPQPQAASPPIRSRSAT